MRKAKRKTKTSRARTKKRSSSKAARAAKRNSPSKAKRPAKRKSPRRSKPSGTAKATRARSKRSLVRRLPVDLHVDPQEPSPKVVRGARLAKSIWRVAPSLLTLLGQVNGLAPQRSKKSDGTIGDAAHATRASDHNPWVMDGGTGIVTAMDITHDPQGGCDANNLAEAIRQTRDPRVKYVIWNRQIVSSTVSPWTWRAYAGSNPHTKHMHISVRPEKPSYASEENWQGLAV